MGKEKERVKSYIFGSLGYGDRVNGGITEALIFATGTVAAVRMMDIIRKRAVVKKAVERSLEGIIAGLDVIK